MISCRNALRPHANTYNSVVLPLQWSPSALAAATADQRRDMTELFQAYFRVGFPTRNPEPGTTLHLDLPSNTSSRYVFHAMFTREFGWRVEAKLKAEHLQIRFRLLLERSSSSLRQPR